MSLLVAYFLLAIGVSFLCSLLEAVILSVTHSQIGMLVKTNPKQGKMLQKLKDDINRPLAAILTLNTISHTLGAAGMGAQVLYLYGSGAVAIASAVLTFCILVFSEILPKTIGAYFCRSLAIPSAYLIRFLMVIAFPFVWLSNTLSKSISSKEDKVSREEIAAMAEMGEDEGSIDEQESDIIENLFRLKEIQIEDILTPRSVIYAFEDTQTVGKIMDSTEDIIFSRIPVFNDNIDNIIGMVYKDNLLETMADDYFEKTMSELIEPVEQVYEKESVETVLNKFIKNRSHMFIVKDEFGGTTGIVTLEDCIETLLGVEIMDESDEVADMRKLAKDPTAPKKKKRRKRIELKMKSPIEVFSDWAKDGRDEKMAHGHAESVKAMLDFIIAKLPSPFTFIDAGCGNGWVVQMVGDKKHCKKAIGVDGSQQMIDKAKSVDTIHDYHCEDLMDWFPIQKVDCVFSMEVFYYVDKPHLLLKNIRSDWLKNNGRIIMGIDYYTENTPSESWSKDCGISTMIRLTELEWIESFRFAGFQDIQSWRQGKKDDWSGTLIISAQK